MDTNVKKKQTQQGRKEIPALKDKDKNARQKARSCIIRRPNVTKDD